MASSQLWFECPSEELSDLPKATQQEWGRAGIQTISFHCTHWLCQQAATCSMGRCVPGLYPWVFNHPVSAAGRGAFRAGWGCPFLPQGGLFSVPAPPALRMVHSFYGNLIGSSPWPAAPPPRKPRWG